MLIFISCSKGESTLMTKNKKNKNLKSLIKPDYLKSGDTIAIIAPSGVLNNRNQAIENAKKNIHPIPMAGSTIVHTTTGEHGSSKVLLKPAAPGTGVIAGGAVRQVLEAAGIKDILAKSLGSPTHLNVAKATLNGLLGQRTPDEVAKLRGKNVMEIAPKGLVDAYENTKAERKLKEDAKG